MAKKKVNKRRTYDLLRNDPIVYERSNVQRKMHFLVLRGPGWIQQDLLNENELMNEFAIQRRFKLKFVQVKTSEEVIKNLKDANVWAGGVIFFQGLLTDEDQAIKKALKGI